LASTSPTNVVQLPGIGSVFRIAAIAESRPTNSAGGQPERFGP
jgi:hypothetical protein